MADDQSFRGRGNVWKDVRFYTSRKSCRASPNILQYFKRCIQKSGQWLLQKRPKKYKKPRGVGRPKGSGYWAYDDNRNVIGKNPAWKRYEIDRRERESRKRRGQE